MLVSNTLLTKVDATLIHSTFLQVHICHQQTSLIHNIVLIYSYGTLNLVVQEPLTLYWNTLSSLRINKNRQTTVKVTNNIGFLFQTAETFNHLKLYSNVCIVAVVLL